MRGFERWALHLGALLTGLSGLGYGWLRYYGQVAGEFGPEPHPLQAVVQHAHVLAAPLLLFALGMTVRGHLVAKLRTGGKDGRMTGLLQGLLIAPMVLAGYGVQVVTTPSWRTGLAWVHGIASLVFLVAYLGHVVRTWRRGAGEETPTTTPMGWE